MTKLEFNLCGVYPPKIVRESHKRFAVMPPPLPTHLKAPKKNPNDRDVIKRSLHRDLLSQLRSTPHVEVQVHSKVPEEGHISLLRAIARGDIPLLRPAQTRTCHNVVVGVKDALHRNILRSIKRQEYTLQRSVPPRVRHNVVVNVKNAIHQSSMKTVSRQGFKLKHVPHTRVTTTPVVGVRDAYRRACLKTISRQAFKLKHVTKPPRVTTTPVVGMKTAVNESPFRKCLRRIKHHQFRLNHSHPNRVTHDVVVFQQKQKIDSINLLTVLKENKKLLQNQALLKAITEFASLDKKGQQFVLQLL